MKRLKWPLAALLLVAVIAGGYWLYRTRLAPQTTAAGAQTYTETVQARQGNLNTTIAVVGQLDAAQSADLTFERINGATKLVALQVKPGNTVKAGQALATIDPAPYKQALDQAKSDLQAAEENLTELTTPATDLAIAKADQAIAKAENNLQQAKDDLATLQAPDLSDLQNALLNAQDNLTLAQIQQTMTEHDSTAKSERELQYAINWHLRHITDLKALVAGGKANLEQTQQLVAEQDTLGQAQVDLALAQAHRQAALQVAAAQVATARAALADAQDALAKAEAGADPSTSSGVSLAKAQLAVRQAEVTLATAKDDRAKLNQGPDAVTLASAQADVDKKQLAVADAEAALAGTKLAAPFDGTILQTDAEPGDSITANTHDPDRGKPEIAAGGGVGGRDDDPASDGRAVRHDHLRCPAGPDAARAGRCGAAAGDAARRRDGVRGADLADGGREAAAAGRHDGQRARSRWGRQRMPCWCRRWRCRERGRYQVLVPEPRGPDRAHPGGAGGGRAERRHLHADPAGSERGRQGRGRDARPRRRTPTSSAARAAGELMLAAGSSNDATPVAGRGSVGIMRKLFMVLRVAAGSLIVHKMRSFLTMLGVVIGVGAVIALVAVGQGAQAQVVSQFQSLGSNLLTVTAGTNFGFSRSGLQQSVRQLTNADVEAIRGLATTVGLVAPEYSANGTSVSYQGKTTSHQHQRRDGRVRHGAQLGRLGRTLHHAPRTTTTWRWSSVLGQTVVKNLFGSTRANPIGETIRINRQNYEVIGVLKAKGQSGPPTRTT